MAFKPTGQITLCKVDFDNSYKNVRYFEKLSAQRIWFMNLATQRTFSDYLFVRKVKDDGTLKSSIKVNENIDNLYQYNYLHYYNSTNAFSEHDLYFYCFITDLIYINESTTEVVFETDVYQTWMLKCELKESFVEREHSDVATESELFPSLTGEQFTISEYDYIREYPFNSQLLKFGYLMATSEPLWETDVEGIHSGLYQGLRFYYFNTAKQVELVINGLSKDIVVAITVIPRFAMEGATLYTTDSVLTVSEGELNDSNSGLFYAYGEIGDSSAPKYREISIRFATYFSEGASEKTEGWYFFHQRPDYPNPRNKKLYAPQFHKFVITNGVGGQKEYDLSRFENGVATFIMSANISLNPNVTIVPTNYKGMPRNYDESISLTGFPQCSWNSDSYKIWRAQNNVSQSVSMGSSALGMGLGVAMMFVPTMQWAGVASFASGLAGIGNVLAKEHSAKMLPDEGHVGTVTSDLLTTMGGNNFNFFVKTLRKHEAEQIDNFFDMFGYTVNKLKVPNVSARSSWNYVKTIDVNIIPKTSGIPNRDMSRLKQIYDDGVTLWKKTATVGVYTTSNV